MYVVRSRRHRGKAVSSRGRTTHSRDQLVQSPGRRHHLSGQFARTRDQPTAFGRSTDRSACAGDPAANSDDLTWWTDDAPPEVRRRHTMCSRRRAVVRSRRSVVRRRTRERSSPHRSDGRPPCRTRMTTIAWSVNPSSWSAEGILKADDQIDRSADRSPNSGRTNANSGDVTVITAFADPNSPLGDPHSGPEHATEAVADENASDVSSPTRVCSTSRRRRRSLPRRRSTVARIRPPRQHSDVAF